MHAGLKHGLIFLAWALPVTCLRIIADVPSLPWRYEIWPAYERLRFLELPGDALIVATGAVHGFGSYWIDEPITILGSTIFWYFLTILLMAIGRAIHRIATAASI